MGWVKCNKHGVGNGMASMSSLVYDRISKDCQVNLKAIILRLVELEEEVMVTYFEKSEDTSGFMGEMTEKDYKDEYRKMGEIKYMCYTCFYEKVDMSKSPIEKFIINVLE